MITKRSAVMCAVTVSNLLLWNAASEEPKTSAPLFSESFDDADLSVRGWYDGSHFKIVSEGAFAGKGCIEFNWKENATNPHTSSGSRHSLKATDQLFLRFYLKLSANWKWSGKPYHPHLAHFLTTENGRWHGPARSHLTLYVEPVNGKLRLGATDMENETMPHGLTQGPLKGGYNGKLYDSKETVFNDDKWHCVEAQFQLNTLDIGNDAPNADGIVRGWFDGKLVIEHTDIVFRTTDFPDMKWNQFLLTPYFGPGLLPHAQTLWIDELVVATERVGPLTSTDRSEQSGKLDWVVAMQEVHSRFKGERGTFAQFGDSITASRAFWFGLPHGRENASKEMEAAFQLVNSHMLKDCWDRKGPRFGNQGSMTILWAHENVDTWLEDLNPEVALIMFGTNDLHQFETDEYENKTRDVVKKCLANGTIVILSTIPPRHGYVEKSAEFAEAVRRIARELSVPLTDYHAEILKRRPDDWDGALEKFDAYDGYDVPTLIARDGVHPSNPREYGNDYSAEGLRHNGFALRNYLALMKYSEVISEVCEGEAK